MWNRFKHGKLAASICILLGCIVPTTALADVPQVSETQLDAAPLLLLSGPRAETEPLALALKDTAVRDGGAFVDLREPPPAPPIAALELARAVAAYQAFNYGGALEHLQTALLDAEHSGAEGLSTEELSDLFIMRAMVKHGQGDATAAWQDFVQAATIQPTRHLDAVRFSPSNVASFERARDAVSAGPSAELSVETEPACAVYIDAREVPNGQAERLPAGLHFVRVQCPGAATRAQKVLVHGDPRVLRMLPVPAQAPTRESILALARERGFRHLILAHAHASSGAPATAIFQLMRADGHPLAETSMALGEGQTTRRTALAALARLLDTLQPVAIEAPLVKSSAPWYRSPWLWVTVGAAASAAVILPFALQKERAPGFTVSLGGQTP